MVAQFSSKNMTAHRRSFWSSKNFHQTGWLFKFDKIYYTNVILCYHTTCICICLVSCVFFCWSCFTLSASSLLRPMSTSSLEGLTPDPPIGDLRPLGELNPTTKMHVQQHGFVSATTCIYLIWRTLTIDWLVVSIPHVHWGIYKTKKL